MKKEFENPVKVYAGWDSESQEQLDSTVTKARIAHYTNEDGYTVIEADDLPRLRKEWRGEAPIEAEDARTFDIVLSDETADEGKGFALSLQEARDYLDDGVESGDFSDYVGGTASIVCNESGETVETRPIKDVHTYDVRLSKDGDEEYKGLSLTLDEARTYVEAGLIDGDFPDYMGGTAAIVCNEDDKVVESTKIVRP